MKFKLLAGLCEINKKICSAGDIVESDENLIKKFGSEKFELIIEEEIEAPEEETETEETEEIEAPEEETEEAPKKQKRRNRRRNN